MSNEQTKVVTTMFTIMHFNMQTQQRWTDETAIFTKYVYTYTESSK